MEYLACFLLGVLGAIFALGYAHQRRRKLQTYGDGLVSALGGGGPGTPEDEGGGEGP